MKNYRHGLHIGLVISDSQTTTAIQLSPSACQRYARVLLPSYTCSFDCERY